MLTSSMRAEDKKKAFAYNAVVEYIEKPLTEALIQQIANTYFND